MIKFHTIPTNPNPDEPLLGASEFSRMRTDDRNTARIKHQQPYLAFIVWDLDRRAMLRFTDFGAYGRGFILLSPSPFTDQQVNTCTQQFI